MIKDKYIDESYGFWFEFGTHSDGSFDIVSSDDRLDAGPVPLPIGQMLIHEHNRVQTLLVKMAQAFSEAAPEAFREFWSQQQ